MRPLSEGFVRLAKGPHWWAVLLGVSALQLVGAALAFAAGDAGHVVQGVLLVVAAAALGMLGLVSRKSRRGRPM